MSHNAGRSHTSRALAAALAFLIVFGLGAGCRPAEQAQEADSQTAEQADEVTEGKTEAPTATFVFDPNAEQENPQPIATTTSSTIFIITTTAAPTTSTTLTQEELRARQTEASLTRGLGAPVRYVVVNSLSNPVNVDVFVPEGTADATVAALLRRTWTLLGARKDVDYAIGAVEADQAFPRAIGQLIYYPGTGQLTVQVGKINTSEKLK